MKFWMGMNTELDEKILVDCEPVVQGMGCDIVEARSLRGKKGCQVYMVIWKADGVSLDICADVLKTLRPRIQMLTDDPDVHIEVSSPGMDRLIKTPREYRVFRGRGLRLLTEGENEWAAGILTDVAEGGLTLTAGNDSRTFAFSDIRKAKLDHTQEDV
jgi:ribosome maturation factor RimP